MGFFALRVTENVVVHSNSRSGIIRHHVYNRDFTKCLVMEIWFKFSQELKLIPPSDFKTHLGGIDDRESNLYS